MAKLIPVVELFGPTIQGEGMVIGQKTMFVRTGGCDYRCRWCDSAFTWDGSEKSEPLSAEEIIERLDSLCENGYSHVTISGGNPAIHKGIGELVALLNEKGVATAIETQGSIFQCWINRVDEVTVSPKPPSSGMETDWTKLDLFLQQLQAPAVSLKVVVFDDADYQYAKHVHKRYPTVPFYLQTGNEDFAEKEDPRFLEKRMGAYEALVEKALADKEMNNVRVLPQLHTWLWGNKRGV
ncbi:7-carboxy-7-deazaguanine synthase QueE [Shouchella clausii]|uniref:7-carboxy-7-deazaguanine synthase n=2 Tax=Shouchella TaxID=2893057 RepID=A0A268P2X8_SHOCL|nr:MULTISPECIES: 7-carboxy-7-deazaguanine synthase QueE [Shouchella]MCM3312052.1 7-carboxy-7-deazaguanine synthase QueE [Psychrobacillus sp. MER TA 17]ALA54988.1 Queuosine Biosynthesis QueE Radical SAM [Shouchella clausii]KKI87948.1 7-carboxy-7-deazaguanine synthase [Shouchella clausii]MBU3230964.1 7-carboxy-7-deazaguanine synthase QueE [Shouchella clausii]MBU3262961.1 7-carboxy-7-deazaguanine synthase QueE [Shouchella clausii]